MTREGRVRAMTGSCTTPLTPISFLPTWRRRQVSTLPVEVLTLTHSQSLPLRSPFSCYLVDLISHTFSSFLSSSRPPPLWLSSPCKRDDTDCVQLTDPPQAHIVMRQWLCGCYHLINQAWVAHWGRAAASFKLCRSSWWTCLCWHHAGTHIEAHFILPEYQIICF